MKPVTALAVIVVVFLVVLGIIFWQLGLFEGKLPETVTLPIDPVTSTDLAGITSTGLDRAPNYYEPIPSTGGLDRFSTPMTPIQPASTSYTVKPGDTLWIIAQHFYNDGTKWKLIQDANKIADPSKIKAGMVLVIPAPVEPQSRPGGTTYSGVEPEPTVTAPSTIGGKYHKVVKGDNLWKLARKYYNDSTKTTVIFEANRDKLATSETSLQPGWKLLIPDAPKKESPPKADPAGKPKTSSKKTTTTKPSSPSTSPPSSPTGWDNTPTGVDD